MSHTTHINQSSHTLATYCNITLQHTATHCNALQKRETWKWAFKFLDFFSPGRLGTPRILFETHCNTLQHTATCDMLPKNKRPGSKFPEKWGAPRILSHIFRILSHIFRILSHIFWAPHKHTWKQVPRKMRRAQNLVRDTPSATGKTLLPAARLRVEWVCVCVCVCVYVCVCAYEGWERESVSLSPATHTLVVSVCNATHTATHTASHTAKHTFVVSLSDATHTATHTASHTATQTFVVSFRNVNS